MEAANLTLLGNAMTDGLDCDGEPAVARINPHSDMWRAVVLFLIFAATIGIALIPATKLPVLLSLLNSSDDTPVKRPTSPFNDGQKLIAGVNDAVAATRDASGGLFSAGDAQNSPGSPQVVQASHIDSQVLTWQPSWEGARGSGSEGNRQTYNVSNQEVNPVLPVYEDGAGRGTMLSAPRFDVAANQVSEVGWPNNLNTNAGLAAIGFPATEVAADPISLNPPQTMWDQTTVTLAENSPAEGIGAGDRQRLTELERHFQALGAIRYRLERWGEGGRLYRFSCEMPLAASTQMTRVWEAVASSGEEAMLRVLQAILSSQAVGGAFRD